MLFLVSFARFFLYAGLSPLSTRCSLSGEEGHRSNGVCTCLGCEDSVYSRLSVCGVVHKVCVCVHGNVLFIQIRQLKFLFWHKQVKSKRKTWSLSQIVLYNLRCTQKYNSGWTLVKKYYLWTNSSKDRKGATTSSAGFMHPLRVNGKSVQYSKAGVSTSLCVK